MSLCAHIHRLMRYASHQGLLDPLDVDYAYNRLLDLLQVDPVNEQPDADSIPAEPSELLVPLLDHAASIGLLPVDTVQQRDRFEAKIMDVLMPRPSEVIRHFDALSSPKEQTDWFYHISQASNYIKTARTSQNIVWKADTVYGEMDITINLSKPEKDPKDIILQGKRTSRDQYPACLLCKENVGYNGKSTGIGRTNHRIVPVTLNGESFHLQYSPYVYYNEHCIVLQDEHVPMNVTKATFVRLLDFVDRFDHYFLGSNAGLPIVGGSILSHEHYQGGRHHFPIEDARVIEEFVHADVTYQRLLWPLSVIRLRSTDRQALTEAAITLYHRWEHYHNPALQIHRDTDGVPHNAITPIARKKKDIYELDITLRNNRTSDAYPLGIFHPHPEHHHIKKENIGLIEVMGLAVLPARLKTELEEIKQLLLEHKRTPDHLAHHDDWILDLCAHYDGGDPDDYLKHEVAVKFTQVLEDAGVFAQDEAGQTAFSAFLKEVRHG